MDEHDSPLTADELIRRLQEDPGFLWCRPRNPPEEVTDEQLIALIREEEAYYRDPDDQIRWWKDGATIWQQRPGTTKRRKFAFQI